MKVKSDLNENTLYWFEKSIKWMDNLWSKEMSLCKSPANRDDTDNMPVRHTIRNSVWYATGLLMRQEDVDVERAQQIITAIMTYQFDEPSTVYHGTFYRAPSEPHPPENPTEWKDYDPNWREFICSVFIILLKEFDELLSAELKEKMYHSIKLAAEGAYSRKVPAEYTNISLMSAFLLDYAGIYFDNLEWRDYALSQAHAINDLFAEHKTFYEYNSPTYYGVDFYALALWRKYGSSVMYQSMGEAMEIELWRDTVQFYHADMKNICGPYDRSYGMDMQDYVAVVGLWIASALPSNKAPLPNVDELFNHPGDFFFVPLIALVDVLLPDDAILHLQAFQGERYLERTIEPQRTVTAWLSQHLMLGGESDLVNIVRSDQFHPATAHWKSPDGTIAWLRTRSASLIQAIAKPNELHFSGTEDEPYSYVFEIHAVGATKDMIAVNRWTLPSIIIDIEHSGTISIREENSSIFVQVLAEDGVILKFRLI